MRNHLLEMGYSHISCYSHGRELKAGMKQRNYDLLLMDFHLGDNKNGVEVIQDLQKDHLLKAKMCLMFITSDRLPMIVGQIVDVHPDALVLKPYTIRNLEKTLNATLNQHFYLSPVLKLMDEQDFNGALQRLDELLRSNQYPKYKTNMIKLRARLLIKLEKYKEASDVYSSVLKGSDKIIWAKWGLIQSRYMAGEEEISQEMLENMVGTHLTNDKACEWLARISINKKEYIKAEDYIAKIKEGEMSLPAARLKAYLYQVQDKMDDAINLLERKRDSNRNIRERYAELSLDLARCYLSLAESKTGAERKKVLQVTRFLIGSAGRKNVDEVLLQKRNYMATLVAILEGDLDKANELLSKEGMDDLSEAEIPTMTDAAKAWAGVGNEMKASEILCLAEMKLGDIDDQNERTISSMLLTQSNENIGSKKSRALKFNKQGMGYYQKDEFGDAIDYFYQAHILIESEPAFALNLLQSLVEDQQAQHKTIRTLRLMHELESQNLSAGNASRLQEIVKKVDENKDVFVVAEPPPGESLERL